VVRLVGQFADRHRIDVSVERIEDGASLGTEWTEDVPVDRIRGEITLLHPGEAIRALPSSTFRLEAVERDPTGAARSLGSYTLEHSPWPA
jgi:hypothetical protein